MGGYMLNVTLISECEGTGLNGRLHAECDADI